MQLGLTHLLTGLLIALPAEAAPRTKRESRTRVVTVPLRRAEHASDIHPHILLQQLINRSHRRLARMTGRNEPSTQELTDKFIVSVVNPVKRNNRIGAPADWKGEPIIRDADIAVAGDTPLELPPLDLSTANLPTSQLDIDAVDRSYYFEIQLGTPPKKYSVAADSGSADFWVGGESCKSTTQQGNVSDCGNHTFLGAHTSSSFNDTGIPWSITYMTGKVSGSIVQDNLVVAGLSLNHTFGVAKQETIDFSANTTPYDGIMGFARSRFSSHQGLPTVIEALANSKLVDAAITSYKIPRKADNKSDGEITFGALDATKFDKQTLVTMPNVNPYGFWEADMDNITVDGTDLGLTGRTAIFDTGSTLILMPMHDAKAIHEKIRDAKEIEFEGSYILPCNTTASVALIFGGRTFAIDPRDIAPQPQAYGPLAGYCRSRIISSILQYDNAKSLHPWLVGDVFLKNAYFSTDLGKDTISLAKLV